MSLGKRPPPVPILIPANGWSDSLHLPRALTPLLCFLLPASRMLQPLSTADGAFQLM